jgi:hypothetical protein
LNPSIQSETTNFKVDCMKVDTQFNLEHEMTVDGLLVTLALIGCAGCQCGFKFKFKLELRLPLPVTVAVTVTVAEQSAASS